MKMRTVTVDVDIDASDVLDSLDSEDLIEELKSRGVSRFEAIPFNMSELTELFTARTSGNIKEMYRLLDILLERELGRRV